MAAPAKEDKLKNTISNIERKLGNPNLSPEERYDYEKWLEETKEELYACQQ